MRTTQSIGLRSEIDGFEYHTEHWRAVINFEADLLSRLEAGKELPESLRDVPPVQAPARDPGMFIAWPTKADVSSAQSAG